MKYNFSTYNKDDIIADLFAFTDALRDEGKFSDKENELLDLLRDRYIELCTSEVD